MDSNVEFLQKLKAFQAEFSYQYVGGGYFRDMSVPKGTNADIKHGDEIIRQFCEDFANHLAAESAGGKTKS